MPAGKRQRLPPARPLPFPARGPRAAATRLLRARGGRGAGGGGGGEGKARERQRGRGARGRQAAGEATDRHSEGAQAGGRPAPGWCLAPRGGGGQHAISPVPCGEGGRSAAPRGRIPSSPVRPVPRPPPPPPTPTPTRRPTQHHADHVQRHEGQPRPVKHAGSARRQARRRRLARRGDSLGPRGGSGAEAAGRGSAAARRCAASQWRPPLRDPGTAATVSRTALLPPLRRPPGL